MRTHTWRTYVQSKIIDNTHDLSLLTSDATMPLLLITATLQTLRQPATNTAALQEAIRLVSDDDDEWLMSDEKKNDTRCSNYKKISQIPLPNVPNT